MLCSSTEDSRSNTMASTSGRNSSSNSHSSGDSTGSEAHVRVEIWKQHPPYDLLSQCDLAITTVSELRAAAAS